MLVNRFKLLEPPGLLLSVAHFLYNSARFESFKKHCVKKDARKTVDAKLTVTPTDPLFYLSK